MIHGMILARRQFAAMSPLPLRERERVRGDKRNQASSPLSSSVRDCVVMARNLRGVILNEVKNLDLSIAP